VVSRLAGSWRRLSGPCLLVARNFARAVRHSVLFWWHVGLIVVSVTMDTIQQVQSHLLAHQYEGLIQKSQLRGKGKKRGSKGVTRK